MDRRSFFKLSASGVAVAMLPLQGCSTTAPLPALDHASGPVAIAADGTRYELHPTAHQLVITSAQGEIRVGGLGRAAGKLNYPIRIALLDGLAYVVECGNHRVQVFDAQGTSVGMIGEGELLYPKGIAATEHELLIADSRNARIAGFSHDGALIASYGVGVLSGPYGMITTGDTMLVADPGLRQVIELARDGKIVRRFGGDFVLPYDVACDGSSVFVADASANQIAVHERSGRRIETIELATAPTFVSFASDGILYAG